MNLTIENSLSARKEEAHLDEINLRTKNYSHEVIKFERLIKMTQGSSKLKIIF